MAQYLHIRVEDIDLLLPALQVHEVIGLDQLKPQTDGHAIWRDVVISVFDLGQVLKRCATAQPREFGVVYSTGNSDQQPVLMVIDQVLGLRNPSREQLRPLPGMKNTAHDFFDAICIDNKLGVKAYCVKAQLPEKLFT